MNYDSVRQTTINLGLRRPYKKQKNEGVTPMREFSPLSYWAADGKQIRVSVNGHRMFGIGIGTGRTNRGSVG